MKNSQERALCADRKRCRCVCVCREYSKYDVDLSASRETSKGLHSVPPDVNQTETHSFGTIMQKHRMHVNYSCSVHSERKY